MQVKRCANKASRNYVSKGIVMKQRQNLMNGYQDTFEVRARWVRRLQKFVLIAVFLWLGIKALFAAPGSAWIWAVGIYVVVVLCAPFIMSWFGSRQRRGWRREGVLFEPSLPRPVSDIPEEQEWTVAFHPAIRVPLAGIYVVVVLCAPFIMSWFGSRQRRGWRREGVLFEPSLPRPVSDIPEEQEWTVAFHPAIRVPLAVVLIGLMYWVVVLNQMQMPGEWLVATTVVAIINLWAWREPLILVLIVAVGVLLLTIIGWIVSNLPLEGIVAVVILLAGLVSYGVILLRKRQSQQAR